MKKLNKKGFTLVELLAVIVILALLLVVVGNTALPAMKNAKVKSLETYSSRVIEQAKALKMSDDTKCTAAAKCSLSDIMGSDVSDKYTSTDIVVTGSITQGYKVSGTVTDKDNNTATIADNVVTVTAAS